MTCTQFQVQCADELEKLDCAHGCGIGSEIALKIRTMSLPEVKQKPVNFKPLSSKVVEQGWRDTFSVNNPYCPCDLRTFEKSVIWAERELGKQFEVLRKENERLGDEIATWKDAFSNLDQINKGVALKGGVE